jgi:hypothetical protein
MFIIINVIIIIINNIIINIIDATGVGLVFLQVLFGPSLAERTTLYSKP